MTSRSPLPTRQGPFGCTYHFLERAFKGPDDQTLVGNLLLGEEARGRGAGGAGGPHASAERGGAGQRAAGGRALGLLAQAGGRQDGRVPQDLHQLPQLLGHVVLQQAGRHHRRARARVAVEQRPVVAANAFRFLRGEGQGGVRAAEATGPWGSAHPPGGLAGVCREPPGQGPQLCHCGYHHPRDEAPCRPTRRKGPK